MICEPAEKQAMVVEHWPLVRRIAAQMRRSLKLDGAADVDDMASDGVIGLMNAIDQFDPAKGTKFTTYAHRRIRGAILDAIRERDWVPRLVRDRKQEAPLTCSMETTAYTRHDGTRVSFTQSLEDPHTRLAQRSIEDRESITRIMRGLAPNRRLAALLYHVDGLTMKETGHALGISESRTSRLLAEVLEVLQSRPSEAA